MHRYALASVFKGENAEKVKQKLKETTSGATGKEKADRVKTDIHIFFTIFILKNFKLIKKLKE